MSENPGEWLKDPQEKDRQRETTGLFNSVGNVEEFEELVSQLRGRFPGNISRVISFAGSEANPQTPYTCVAVARCLENAIDGRILVIDSDLDSGEFSRIQSTDKKAGLTNCLTQNLNWRTTVYQTRSSKVDFLSLGNQKIRKLNQANEHLAALLGDLRNEYEYICVNVGDAHNEAACLWSDRSDGTYLVVSMIHSSQTVAKSAVNQIKNYGGRLIGCVVSDTQDR